MKRGQQWPRDGNFPTKLQRIIAVILQSSPAFKTRGPFGSHRGTAYYALTGIKLSTTQLDASESRADPMSSWHHWCSESQNRGLSANLTKLSILSATVIFSYATAFVVGAFFWWRWFKLRSVRGSSSRLLPQLIDIFFSHGELWWFCWHRPGRNR
jgi:hypothetical protein